MKIMFPPLPRAENAFLGEPGHMPWVVFSHHRNPYSGPCALGVVAIFTYEGETIWRSPHLPPLNQSRPNRAISTLLIQTPPPQRVPPLTDAMRFPPMFTYALV